LKLIILGDTLIKKSLTTVQPGQAAESEGQSKRVSFYAVISQIGSMQPGRPITTLKLPCLLQPSLLAASSPILLSLIKIKDF